MSLVTRGSIPKLTAEGVMAFMDGDYADDTQRYYDKLFNTISSKKAYEEFISYINPAFALEGSEGSPTPYQGMEQLFTTRITPVIIKLGMMITHEAKADNLYPAVFNMATALVKAFKATKEVYSARIFARAFNSSFVYGDGKELCATDHPSGYGTYSNELATPARLSQSALEDLVVQISTAKTFNGQQANLTPQKILISPREQFNIIRILKTDLQSGTANNDTNALRVFLSGKGSVEVVVNPWLQNERPFFILNNTPAMEGLVYLEREKFNTGKDNSGDARIEKVFGYERYTFSCTDPRAVYGSNAV